MKFNKKEIRKTVLDKVSNVTNRTERSFLMRDDLFPIIRKYQHIALFASLDSEIDTFPLIEKLLKERKDIYLPKTNGDIIDFYKVEDLSSLIISKDKYKVREPNGGEKISPMKIEVIICPGVAFDKNGNRMGHGKGYYDRYLASSPAYKIGVCYKEQLLNEIPYEEHDVKMDMVKAY